MEAQNLLLPLAAAIRSMCDLGAQLTASWNQLPIGFLLRGENRRKTLEAEKRTNTNSTHLWRRVRESNLGHIGGRRVLSPLRYPCSTVWKCSLHQCISPSADLSKTPTLFLTGLHVFWNLPLSSLVISYKVLASPLFPASSGLSASDSTYTLLSVLHLLFTSLFSSWYLWFASATCPF